MKNLTPVAVVLLVLSLAFSFVGCSSYFKEARFNPTGSGISQPVEETTVMRPTTTYGLVLITLILLIGIGLWVWEVHEEKHFDHHGRSARKR